MKCATRLTDGSMATGLMSAKLERVVNTSLERYKDIGVVSLVRVRVHIFQQLFANQQLIINDDVEEE